jgi:hypothetical protein
MPKNKEPISEKEQRLLEALKRLTPKELEAYRYFIKTNQMEVAEEASDKMFELFSNGSTCDDIRKIVQAYSFGQIVACRVIGDWDNRKLEKQLAMKTVVPEQNPIQLLEAREFLGDLIVATNRKFSRQLKGYIATGDILLLEGLPIPKNMKEYQILLQSFLEASGQSDTKKLPAPAPAPNINVQVNVNQNGVKEDDNEITLDELLGITVVDVDFVPTPKKQLTDGKE